MDNIVTAHSTKVYNIYMLIINKEDKIQIWTKDKIFTCLYISYNLNKMQDIYPFEMVLFKIGCYDH